MIIKDWKKDIFTIPNILSLFRLVLIPVYVTIFLRAEELADYILAAAILAVSCLTDMIDGKIARHFNMISTVGKFLDPVADKATQFAMLMCLTVHYPVLWGLAILFVIKEGFQLIAGLVMFRKGKMLIGALITGKICTTVLFLSLIIMVLMPQLPEQAVNIITLVDGIVMGIAFVHYAFTYYKKTPMIQNIPEE